MSSKNKQKKGSGTKSSLSKRQAMREERKKKERQQRIIMIAAIIGVPLIIAGLIIVPSTQNANEQVVNIVQVTPEVRAMEDGTNIGDPNSPIHLQLFEDFKCSACQSYHQSIEADVISDLAETGRVYYTFYQYPFMDDNSSFKDSDQAALASECAAEQNRFWDYKDILFSNMNFVTGEFSNDRLMAMAESLELDMKAFTTCYEEKTYQDKIEADLQLGQELGISGTPSLLINGENISPGYVPTYDQIIKAVEEAESALNN